MRCLSVYPRTVHSQIVDSWWMIGGFVSGRAPHSNNSLTVPSTANPSSESDNHRRKS